MGEVAGPIRATPSQVVRETQHTASFTRLTPAFATRALAAGESDAVVAALLGHSSTAMIHKHYSHLDGQARVLKDAAERVATRAG